MGTPVMSVLDGLLAMAVVGLAWTALAGRRLFRSAVLFIALGVFLAVAWARLGAPDVALAEVALGAGVTGALLMRAVGGTSRHRAPRQAIPGPVAGTSRAARGSRAAATVAAALGGALVWAVLSLPSHPPTLGEAVMRDLGRSGASHPVTAVLLNFRAWDTLLEVTVLLAALVGTYAFARAPNADAPRRQPDVVLVSLARVLMPISYLAAGYILWKGTRAPGGAFQAGAVLTGAGIMAVLSGLMWPERWQRRLTAMALVIGPGGFAALAVVGWFTRGALLAVAPERAAVQILLIEAAVTLSIALTLLGLFLGVAAGSGRDTEGRA
ncbi:MAG: hydrogenase subunit MbhD domain-containing protein [Vicinamibacterales bacterium]